MYFSEFYILIIAKFEVVLRTSDFKVLGYRPSQGKGNMHLVNIILVNTLLYIYTLLHCLHGNLSLSLSLSLSQVN